MLSLSLLPLLPSWFMRQDQEWKRKQVTKVTKCPWLHFLKCHRLTTLNPQEVVCSLFCICNYASCQFISLYLCLWDPTGELSMLLLNCIYIHEILFVFLISCNSCIKLVGMTEEGCTNQRLRCARRSDMSEYLVLCPPLCQPASQISMEDLDVGMRRKFELFTNCSFQSLPIAPWDSHGGGGRGQLKKQPVYVDGIQCDLMQKDYPKHSNNKIADFTMWCGLPSSDIAQNSPKNGSLHRDLLIFFE